MDTARISVPLRTSNISGKKMRKRRELDALVASNGMKRFSGYNNSPVCVKPGTNYHDQLLSESSDDQEDYWRSRSKAANKRNRSAMFKRRCSSVLNVCTVLLMFGCVMVTSTVLWLFLDIKHQANYLHNEMDQVVAGNQGIPESVRQCHSQTKELQKNQSQMSVRIDSLNTQLNNLSKEISQISNELKSIQHKLTVSPASSNVPTDLKELSENVGNWISELNDTVAQLKQSENHLKDGFQALRLNVTSLKEKLSLLDQVPKYSVVANNEASRSDFQQLIFNLTSSVTYLNTTLSDEINLIKRNYSHDHLLIENLQSFLSQNITLRLSALQDEYKAEHLQFASLSDTVKNLTNQFNSTRSKMNKLTDEMNVLRGFQADEKNRKLDEVSTTLLPVAN